MTDLPESWSWATLGDVSDHPQYGFTTRAAECGNFRFLRTTDITSGQINWRSVPFCEVEPEQPTKYLLQDGDIVISRAGSVGFSLLVTQPQNAVFASYLIRFRPRILAKYFAYFLKSSAYWQQISDNKAGIAVPNVNAVKLSEISIPVAPLPEQHRIVAKIEALFSELDAGQDSLTRAQAQLKLYRQSLLKAAFQGRLTADWRKANPDKLEPPETLLARIRSERDARYKQALDNWQTALTEWQKAGEIGHRPRKPSGPRDQTADEPLRGAFDPLPHGWTYSRLGSVLFVVSGGTPRGIEDTIGKGLPFYKVSDMNSDGNVRWMRRSKICLSLEERDNLGLTSYPDGTVIFPKRGGAILTNKKRQLAFESCFDLNIMGVFSGISSILDEYLWYWFLALDLSKIYDGSNVPQINNKNIEPLSFPLCSREEQIEITKILATRLSQIDAMETEITTALAKLSALRQSILKKAFSGQLVPQDPTDEPAAALLSRLRNAAPTEKPRRKVRA